MAHSFQVVGALVHSVQGVVAVPLAGRIDEGVVLCNALKETLLTKLLTPLAMSMAYTALSAALLYNRGKLGHDRTRYGAPPIFTDKLAQLEPTIQATAS
jgi:hypothetical protein